MAINVDVTVTFIFIGMSSYFMIRFFYLFFRNELTVKKFTEIIAKNKTNSALIFLWFSLIGYIASFVVMSFSGIDPSNTDFTQNQQYFISNIGKIGGSIIIAALILGLCGVLIDKFVFVASPQEARTKNKKR